MSDGKRRKQYAEANGSLQDLCGVERGDYNMHYVTNVAMVAHAFLQQENVSVSNGQ